MIIRIRVPSGKVYRLEWEGLFSARMIGKKLFPTLDATDSMECGQQNNFFSDAQLKKPLVENSHIQHGSMIYISPSNPPMATDHETVPIINDMSIDPLDSELLSTDGKQPLSKHEECGHGANSMCSGCRPYEPYDSVLQKSLGLRHMSFHAYIRMLNDSNRTGVRSISGGLTNNPPSTPAVETTSANRGDLRCSSGDADSSNCTASANHSTLVLDQDKGLCVGQCTSHKPWPFGMCTRCHPLPISLHQQPFRMVDHIEISNGSIVDGFIDHWRVTGMQHAGFLFGEFSNYPSVPLGVKAVVHHIALPPQEVYADGLLISIDHPLFDSYMDALLAVAKAHRMHLLGVVYTDLQAAPEAPKVLHTRGAGLSPMVGSSEVAFMAAIQNRFPFAFPLAKGNVFGSRMSALLLTGSSDGHIDLLAYQVSVLGSRLINAGVIVPTTDTAFMAVSPVKTNLGRNAPIPEITYSTSACPCVHADPLIPVEYFIVMETAASRKPQNIDNPDSSTNPLPNPHDNTQRSPGSNLTPSNADPIIDIQKIFKVASDSQELASLVLSALLSAYFSVNSDLSVLFADWNWLIGLYLIMPNLPSSESLPGLLGTWIASHDPIVMAQIECLPVWDALRLYSNEDSSSQQSITCAYCTFKNPVGIEFCEMCGLPPYPQ